MTSPNNNNKFALLLGLLIIAWVAALLVESSQPQLTILKTVAGLDKVAHFFAFSGLGLLVCALSSRLNPRPTIPYFSMPFAVVAATGIIEESYQLFVPGRAASLLDLLADISGAVFAIVIANRYKQYLRANNKVCSKAF